MGKTLSFVIPCYRSEDTIRVVIEEISAVMQKANNYDYEIITVNDCSPDRVLAVLEQLAEENLHVKVIDFAKNMGKGSAVLAGFAAANGDIIVSLDDDGQCPVDQTLNLIAPLENGYDVSIARYPHKKQSALKNFGSHVNALMARILLDKPKGLQTSNFFAVKRYICDEMLRYKNPYPYISGLFLRATSYVINVDMEERERICGTSGFTFLKSFKLLLNGFTAFSVKPLRVATISGLITALFGFLFAIYIVVKKIFHPEIEAGYSSLMAVILFIGGVIMLCLGLIGEYVGRIYISLNSSPQYVIRRTINIKKETAEVTNADFMQR